MLHGGAWRFGDKRAAVVWRRKAENWVTQGFVFISVNTRLLPQVGPVDEAADLAAALAFIQTNAASFGGNAATMILMGHSSGAHVAGLVATRDDIRIAAGVRGWAGTILLDTAALDVPAIMRDKPYYLYRRAFGTDPDDWRAASPALHMDADEGPFLLVCSSRRATACPAAEAFAQQSTHATVLPVDLSHGAINRTLGADNAYTAQVEAWIGSVLQ